MGTGEGEFPRGGRSGDEARRRSLQTLGRLAWAKVQKRRTCGWSGEVGKEAGEAGSNLTAEDLAYWTLELKTLSCGDDCRTVPLKWGAFENVLERTH